MKSLHQLSAEHTNLIHRLDLSKNESIFEVSMILSESTIDQISEVAAAANLSVSDWVKNTIILELIKIERGDYEPE